MQLGFFANLDNALAFKQRFIDSGYEARVIVTGLPGEQRYRVISGLADDPAELLALRDDIERRTGQKGFAKRNPLDDTRAREISGDDPFEPPKSRHLLAQAGPAEAGASPMRASAYQPMLNRTPQERIESMPGFNFAGLAVIPTVGLSLGFDDNITRSRHDEISSWYYMISPAIRVELPSDHSVLALTAGIDFVRYDDSPVDDREPWYLRADWDWDISTRQNLNLFANYSEGVDQRGEGRRQGNTGLIALEPDQWKRFGYGGAWDYGAVGARGRLSLLAGINKLTYTNNPLIGNAPDRGARSLDRDWQYFGGTFFWRVAPKTSLLLDYLHTDMNYDNNPQSDSTIQSLMLGVTWDATARTSGTIRYGIHKRRLADPAVKDYDGPTWLASIDWRPRTYSLFTLSGTRTTQEPDGNGNYLLRQDITLSWMHDWATRFGTAVDIGYGQDDYRPLGRSDDLFYWSVGAYYTFNPHFRFGASVRSYDRSSDVGQYDYRRMVYLLTLEASF